MGPIVQAAPRVKIQRRWLAPLSSSHSWVLFDRKIAGRARTPDVYDYRSGYRPQQFSDDGQACPADRADPEYAWINLNVQTGDDPSALAAALETSGVTLSQLVRFFF